MTLEDVKELLQRSGLPVAYLKWPDGPGEPPPPPLPYLIFYEDSDTSMYADGGTYYVTRSIVVELYSKLREPETEARLETLMQGLHWKRTGEQYLDTEHMTMCSYGFEV